MFKGQEGKNKELYLDLCIHTEACYELVEEEAIDLSHLLCQCGQDFPPPLGWHRLECHNVLSQAAENQQYQLHLGPLQRNRNELLPQ